MKLCSPAIIYLLFSITQILIDTFTGLYNTALMKFVIMIIITLLLNILCQNGLGIISWIIVFIPFILMTVIVSILLYVLGLNTTTGTLNYNKNISTDASGNIVIYEPDYNSAVNPVYYNSPNIIVPKLGNLPKNTTHSPNPLISAHPPIISSGYAYKS
jgi:hypothetical protein